MTLSVSFDTDDRSAVALQRTVLASLPGSFALDAGAPASVVVIAGSDDDWPGRVRRAVEGGTRGVFVTCPGSADPVTLRQLAVDARAAGVAVLVAAGYRADPTWTDCLATVRRDLPSLQLVDSVVRVAPAGGPQAVRDALVRGLLEQLGLVGDLIEASVDLEIAHSSESQYVVAAAAGPMAITLTGVISPLGSEQLSLDAVGQNCRWSARFNADAPARPSTVTRWDRSGSLTAPQRYEGGLRRCWRMLHAAIETGAPFPFTLEDLAARLAAVPGPQAFNEFSGHTGERGDLPPATARTGHRQQTKEER
jgi:hypothetical protein